MTTTRAEGMAAHTPTPWRVGMQNGMNASHVYAANGSSLHDEPCIAMVYGIPMHTSIDDISDRYADGLANAAFICLAANNHAALTTRVAELEARVLNLKEALMGLVNQPLRYNSNRIEIDCNDHGDAMARVRIARAALAAVNAGKEGPSPIKAGEL